MQESPGPYAGAEKVGLNNTATATSLANTCLAGCIPDEATLRRRINANVAERNAKHQPINKAIGVSVD